jgi:hypothetical protein
MVRGIHFNLGYTGNGSTESSDKILSSVIASLPKKMFDTAENHKATQKTRFNKCIAQHKQRLAIKCTLQKGKRSDRLALSNNEVTLNQRLTIRCALTTQNIYQGLALSTDEVTLKQRLTIRCSLETQKRKNTLTLSTHLSYATLSGDRADTCGLN